MTNQDRGRVGGGADRLHGLPVDRVRGRVAAYVYGNILVLAAVVAVSFDPENRWAPVIVVVATSVTTFLAHAVAHNIGEALGRASDDARLHVRREARDAVPIISSGAGPAVLLALGALGWLPLDLSYSLATAIIVLRLAATGVFVQRVSGQRSPVVALWSGFALALVSVTIVALKVLLTH